MGYLIFIILVLLPILISFFHYSIPVNNKCFLFREFVDFEELNIPLGCFAISIKDCKLEPYGLKKGNIIIISYTSCAVKENNLICISKLFGKYTLGRFIAFCDDGSIDYIYSENLSNIKIPLPDFAYQLRNIKIDSRNKYKYVLMETIGKNGKFIYSLVPLDCLIGKVVDIINYQ